MKQPMTMLLVEDDAEMCKKFIACLSETSDVLLIGIADTCNKAIELLREQTPQAIVLELALHKNVDEGLHFLQEMNHLSLPFKPYILAATSIADTKIRGIARELGVDYLMSKHQQGYTPKQAVEFLQAIAPTILNDIGDLEAEVE